MTIGEALAWARAELTDASPSPALDAQVLLCAALAVSRSHLYAWPERPVPEPAAERFRDWVRRRQQGQPVAYLTGRQEFWSLELEVTPATLVPRPETELLVEHALAWLPQAPARVLDLGCGSGAIALAIAHERPDCQLVAVDFSAAALEVAQRNGQRLGLERVSFRHGSWYEPVTGQRFHLVVSNPPYIGPDEPEPREGSCRFEPQSALVAEDEGLADLKRIIAGAPDHLLPGGALLLEHGWRQGAAVRALLHERGFDAVSTFRDLQGHERVSGGRLPGASP